MDTKAITIDRNVLKYVIYDDTVTGSSFAAITRAYVRGSFEIPCQIEGYKVVKIAKHAFASCEALTSVVIPVGVTSVGIAAFQDCNNLTSVSIPPSVTEIGRSAFASCSSLMNVTIPFNVMTIGAYAFSRCHNLTSVTIPNSVTSIECGVFYDCCGLTSVTIPSGVINIEANAFSGCRRLTNVAISAGVTRIGTEAFKGCSDMTSVTIPSSITSIGYDAFSGCNRLTSVHISDLAKWCDISFDGRNANPLSFATELYLNDEKVKTLIIPEGVTSIKKYAFSGCSSLTSVVILDGMMNIGEGAFVDCANLIDVLICSTSCDKFSVGAFNHCTRLKDIRFVDRKTGVVRSKAVSALGYDQTGRSDDYYDDPCPDWGEESGWNDLYGRGVEVSDIIDVGD